MKHFILVVIFLISSATECFTQIASDCSVSPDLKMYYEKDVRHLALKRILESNAPAAEEILIPDIWLDSIWQGLAAIYNVQELPERDEVFDQHCIHHANLNGFLIYNAILVNIDENVAWAGNWANLETMTGDTALDDLLETYGFEVTNYLSFNNTAVLSTELNLNVFPLLDMLNTFDGINFAEPDFGIGGANRIFYEYENGLKYFDFHLEWADCFSGCINSKIWKFAVHPDCSVELLDVIVNMFVNEPEPEPVNCNITNDAGTIPGDVFLELFPNPAREILQIKTNNSYNFNIINTGGQQVHTGKLHTGINRIYLMRLPAGIYSFLLSDHTGKKITRKQFVKY